MTKSNQKKISNTPGIGNERLEHLLGPFTIGCSYRCSASNTVLIFQFISKERAALTKIKLVVLLKDFGGETHDLIAGWSGYSTLARPCS